MIGLMGLADDGTLYNSHGRRLIKLPFRMALLVQKVQHKIAILSWRLHGRAFWGTK